MTEAVNEDWVQTAGEAVKSLPSAGDVDARVQYTVTGGPDGKLVFGVVISGGTVTDFEVGKLSDPDCKVSLSQETFAEILGGSVAPEVAFMSGSLKVEGDHATWLVGLRRVRTQAIEALSSD